jgi:DNA-binding FadR family transcriptional regulator
MGDTVNELLIQLGDAIQIALRYSRQLTASIPDNAVAAMPLHWKIAREIEAKHSSCADLAMRALLKKTTSDIEQELATVKIDRESVSAKGESLELSSNSNY